MPNDPKTEELVKDYVRALGSGDPEQVCSFYADNIVYEDTAVNRINYGIEDVKKFIASSVSAPGMTSVVDSCYATDEGFGIAWHRGGIHDHDLLGLPATGRFFTVPGASIARVKNGKIVRIRDFWNNLDLMKQLGVGIK
ncbi:ester cyclase [Nocardia fluminea]|uniref:ester cyclase n=1 Tax=Nocardia fluminea TaxID=134984 RepID=UPI00366B15B0